MFDLHELRRWKTNFIVEKKGKKTFSIGRIVYLTLQQHKV